MAVHEASAIIRYSVGVGPAAGVPAAGSSARPTNSPARISVSSRLVASSVARAVATTRSLSGLMPAPFDRRPAPARIGREGAYRQRGQLRPARTPPSTSQIAPVTQLVSAESRNVIVEATSRAVP